MPRTNLTILLFSIYLFNSSLNKLPIIKEFSHKFSSRITLSAAIATLQPNGFPPYVEPCSPGFIVNMISCDDKTAETGNTPPERALPKIKMSGLKSW